MISIKILGLTLVGICALASCATISRGKQEVLYIKTDPPGAKVSTTNGYKCRSTPCAIKMDRRSDFQVKITKKRCDPVTVNITHKTASGGAAAVVGNVIMGGVVGFGVDAVTGASQDLTPNPVTVKLQCRRR